MPEGKAERLKTLAEQRGVSVNKLMEELATYAIAEFDTETRFRLRAARGSAARGLQHLDALEAWHANQSSPAYGLHDREASPYDPTTLDTPRKPKGKK
jgi:hypothetical protein